MKDIKRRIKSVGSTRQITKAMELVSSSKLRKAKQRAEQARPYFNELYKSMCEIALFGCLGNSVSCFSVTLPTTFSKYLAYVRFRAHGALA